MLTDLDYIVCWTSINCTWTIATLSVNLTYFIVFSGVLATVCFLIKTVMGNHVFVPPFLFISTFV